MRRFLPPTGLNPIPPLILALLAAIASGCAGAAASTGDQGLIDRGQILQLAVAPAVILENPRLAQYIQSVGDRVADGAAALDKEMPSPGESRAWMFGRKVQWHLVDQPVANAFTPGGQHVYIYNGLFQLCRNEGELAGAMSHEFAHIFMRHARNALNPEDKEADDIMRRFITAGYSAEQEQEADDIGFLIYIRGGWDPSRFAGVYERVTGGAPRMARAQSHAQQLPPSVYDLQRPPIADEKRFTERQADAQSLAAGRPKSAGANLLLSAAPTCVEPQLSNEQRSAQAELNRPRIVEPDRVGPFDKGPGR